jgi:hypothetical protein
MTPLIGIAVLLALLLFFYLLKRDRDRNQKAEQESIARLSVTFETLDPENYRTRDDVREQWLRQRCPECDKLIFSKVAGVTHRNSDGCDRRGCSNDARRAKNCAWEIQGQTGRTQFSLHAGRGPTSRFLSKGGDFTSAGPMGF